MFYLVRHRRVHHFSHTDQFGLGNSFEVLRLLGRGGSGGTYLCRDKASQELVAIKLQQRPIPSEDMAYNEALVSEWQEHTSAALRWAMTRALLLGIK